MIFLVLCFVNPIPEDLLLISSPVLVVTVAHYLQINGRYYCAALCPRTDFVQILLLLLCSSRSGDCFIRLLGMRDNFVSILNMGQRFQRSFPSCRIGDKLHWIYLFDCH